MLSLSQMYTIKLVMPCLKPYQNSYRFQEGKIWALHSNLLESMISQYWNQVIGSFKDLFSAKDRFLQSTQLIYPVLHS